MAGPIKGPRASRSATAAGGPSRGARASRRAWLAERRRHIRPGCIVLLEVQHDTWCTIYGPARICTCAPIRVLKDERLQELARAEGLGPYDPLEHLDLIQEAGE
jgi:hypothetical protein